MGFRVRSLNQDQYPGRQGCGGEHVVDQVLLITSIAEGILRRAEGSDDADMLEANRPKFTIKKKTNHREHSVFSLCSPWFGGGFRQG